MVTRTRRTLNSLGLGVGPGRVRNFDGEDNGGAGVGIGIDAYGGTVVEPTKNVRDLVLAESAKRDALRDADTKYNELQHRMQEKLSEAETRRIDALAAQGQRYEERIAEDLKVGVKTTSDQLAGQL